jgi:hypothetical protein
VPVLLAPGILSLVAAAGMAVATGAGLRVEARAQEIRPPVGENVATQGYEVEPVVGLEAWSPTFDLALAYGPRFTHLGGDGPDSDTWLQRAWAVAQWRPAEAWQLRANATATYGVVDLFRVATAPGQPGEPPPVGQAAPVATFLDYRRYELLLGADGRLGQQLDLRSALVLMREGGAAAGTATSK